jgi:adenylate kinase
LDCGGLVGDDLMVSVVRERLERADCQNGFLLDGFPRTIPQAEALDHMLDERGRQLDRVVELHVPDEELSRRLSVRAQESDDPRADDAPELIPRRIQLYHSETAPLLEYYRRRNMRLRVNGVGTIDEVYHRIIESIGSAV